MAGTFRCTLVTPQEQVFDDVVSAVTLPAHDGQMGVLKLHAPMLVQLGYGLLSLTLGDGGKREWFVAGGFAQVKDDVLVVLADEASDPAKASKAEANQSLEAALTTPAQGEASASAKHKQVEKARALARVAQG